VTIAAISLWLIWKEGQKFAQVLHWQFATLLEQDEQGYLYVDSGWSKLFIISWIFVAILLRNLYNSSLYSLIAAESEPTDYPQNMRELVNNTEYQMLVPFRLCSSIFILLYVFQEEERVGRQLILPREIATFYLKLLQKWSCIDNPTGLLPAIESGKARVRYYYYNNSIKHSKPNVNSSLGIQVLKYLAAFEDREFVKYGAICEIDCESNFIVGSQREKSVHKIIPKQNPFFRISEFWTIVKPSFASHFWPTFLGFL